MRNNTVILLLAGVVAVLAAVPAVAQDTDPIATLNSDAALRDKMEACRVLQRVGTKEAIPALAPLLLDAKLAHMARYALEPMPYPEVDEVLRDALGKTSGRLKVGVISSLAARDDEAAVPALIALLPDGDAQVAQAAAKALGVIATPEAADALTDALAKPGTLGDTMLMVCNALLQCAETFAADKQGDKALEIYSQLLQLPGTPPQVHAAALRGTVLTGPVSDGIPLLLDALRGEDEHRFDAGLRIARELRGKKKVTAALAELLPTLPDSRKVRLLDAFGNEDGAAAGPAALSEAQAGTTEVRVAALHAVTRMGYEPALESIEQLTWSDDSEVAVAARDSLSYFPGNKGDAALEAMLNDERPEARRVAVEMIGQGALETPTGPLMNTARLDSDEGVRLAALTALQSSAGIDEMPLLLDALLHARSEAEMKATEAVLASLSERQKRMPSGIVIEKAVYGDLPDGPSADVLEQVRRMVESGSLTVDATNSNFGDPAPGKMKRLRIDYTENGTPVSKTVGEGRKLSLMSVSASAEVVDAFCAAFEKAEGDAKLGMIQLLGSTASPKAFEIVQAAASSEDAKIKDAALRTLCEWPTTLALPVVMDLVKTSTDPSLKVSALRGTVRLLGQGGVGTPELLTTFSMLMDQAASPDEKKIVLSGLAQVPSADALEMVFAQFADKPVKGEALQAAINIARNLGQSAREDGSFFNGTDLAGWQGNLAYWRVEDGAIVGHSDTEIPKNEFLWSDVQAGDFYLVLDVRLEPNAANAGIQFRSSTIDDGGQAQGYQADIGETYWGRLYHEHGRGQLDWTDAAEQAVKPGEWNRYEILAVGPAIWTAINGRLGVAYLDLNADAERTGQIAMQIHSGAPQTVRYRIVKLVHDPRVEMGDLKADDLIIKLRESTD